MPLGDFYDEVFTEKQNKSIEKFISYIRENSDRYDYIILTARRCFCLFNSFKIKGINLDYNKIISSQAIDVHAEKLTNKRVLLCDDIMIHGQSLVSMYEKIKNYNPKTIDVLVMIRNIEKPDYYKYKTETDYDVIVSLDDKEWRNFSNNIVKFIHQNSVLYISYVYGFEVNESFIKNRLAKSSLLTNLSLENNILVHDYYLDKEHEPQYFIAQNIESVLPIREDLVNYATIRIYRDPIKKNSYWAVPYVELVEIENTHLDAIFNRLIALDDRFSKVGTNASSKYKALTAIISFFFFEKLGGHVFSIDITRYIDKSYFDGFYSLILTLNQNELLDIINEEIPFSLNVAVDEQNDENDMIYQLDKLINSQEPISLDDFKEFFFLMNLLDEKEFRTLFAQTEKEHFAIDYVQKNKKLKPISARTYYSKLLKTGDLYKDLLKYTLYFSDSGVVSFVINEFHKDDKTYNGVFIKAGEQSYRMSADATRENFFSIFFVYDLLLYFRNFDERKKLAKKLMDILRQKNNCDLDIKRFEFFFEKQFSNLFNLPNYFFATKTEDIKIDVSKEARIYDCICKALQEIE